MSDIVKSTRLSYQRIKNLGEGKFGEVSLVQCEDTKKQYALKAFRQTSEAERKEFENLKPLLKDTDKFLVKFIESFDANRCYYISTEYCEDGSFQELIEFYKEDKKSLTEDEILDFIYQLAEGLDKLHELLGGQKLASRKAHRFLKPDTIFLQDNRPKIGCIELLTPATQKNIELAGMAYYISPELSELVKAKKHDDTSKHDPGTDYDRPSDLWSLGCILYELTTLRKAYFDHSLDKLYRSIREDKPPQIESSYILGSVLNRLLKPKCRPDAKTLATCLKKIISQKKKEERTIVEESFQVFKELEQKENKEIKSTHFNGTRYKYVKKIGKKLYGTVYLVEDTEDDYKYKALKLINTGIDEQELNDAMKEIKILKEAKNPYIVKFVQDFKMFNQQCIVSEFCINGDLGQMIQRYQKERTKIPPKKAYQIALQLLRALNSLHNLTTIGNRKIIHRNIKPSNIFFDLNKVKIGDFGVATTTSTISNACTKAGSAYYISPEIVVGEEYNQKTDVWSAGVVLFETITLERPFQGNQYILLTSIQKSDADFSKIPDKEPELMEIKQIIKRMLIRDKNQRPDSNTVFKMMENVDQKISNERAKSRLSSQMRDMNI